VLTKQQQKLLFFIKTFQDKNGISPSYDEMRCALNQKSKSSVHMLLNALMERGFVRKLSHKARAIEVLKFVGPVSPAIAVAEAAPALALETAPLTTADRTLNESFCYVPFYGKQATIFPLKTFLSSPEKILTVSKDLVSHGEGQDCCAFQVSGDSLKEMAILDNDILFFKMGSTHQPGQLVLAVVDEETVHMKKWDLRDGKVILSCGNKYMMPQVYEADRVHVKGVLVGLTRQTV
jgi:repressor LexA